MGFHSLRWQLSFSYAGIALLTALVLNLLLLGALRAYYERQELAYLRENAGFITQNLARLIDQGVPDEALAAQLKVLSFLSQTRLRLLDERQEVLADSGSPALAQLEIVVSPQAAVPEALLPGSAAVGQNDEDGSSYGAYLAFRLLAQPFDSALLPLEDPDDPPPPLELFEPFSTQAAGLPLQPGETGVIVLPGQDLVLARSGLPTLNSWFGLGLSPAVSLPAERAEAIQTYPIWSPEDGNTAHLLGYVELSEGPALGGRVLATVAQLGGLTGLAAILLAALAGWLVSRSLSRPVMALAAATTRMAEGDLGARAEVRQAGELGLLAATFNHMAGRLEGLVNTLRQFVADAAHELNTPLAILHTDLDLLVASTPEARQRQLAVRMLVQVQRLEALVRGLLDLSRLEAAPATTLTEPLDLAGLAQEVAERYASQAEQAGLAFELDIQSSPVEVLANREQVAQVLGNLLDNAIKFTPAGGRVRLIVSQAGGWAELQVEDTGIGIPAEDLPELFQRFHRGRNSSAYPGSGLGLAVVQRIVERHGGRVAVESPGEGARFTVRLPSLAGTD